MFYSLMKFPFCHSGPKGQLILKRLFGVFTFFQKMNGNKLPSSNVELFLSFFGRNIWLKKLFQICLTFSIDPKTFPIWLSENVNKSLVSDSKVEIILGQR